MTTDNGSNIIKAARNLSCLRLSCFGHNLHLAVTKALTNDNRCSRALGISRKVVSAFSMSWKQKRDLTKSQLNLGLKQHSLVADCATRWGSMSKMVSRILEQEQAIRLVLSTDRETVHLIPKWQDIDVLQAIDKALSPVASLTDLLSGDSYVTISAVLPILYLINNNLLKEDDDTTLTKDIKDRIKSDLNDRYSIGKIGEGVHSLLHTAMFLDPRFKTKYMDSEKSTNIQETLKQESIAQTMTADSQSEVPKAAQYTPPPKKRKNNLGTLFKDIELNETEQMPLISVEQQVKSELDSYITTSKLDFEEDPMNWWKSHNLEYPLLARLAKKYLCACATSSPSERLFSTSGNIVTPNRCSMKPDKVDMLTFLTRNL